MERGQIHRHAISARVFDQDLSEWNVIKVTDMSFMFYRVSAVNQDLSKRNVAEVINLDMMFNEATSFKQILRGEEWFDPNTNKRSMFDCPSGSISCERFQPQTKRISKSLSKYVSDRLW